MSNGKLEDWDYKYIIDIRCLFELILRHKSAALRIDLPEYYRAMEDILNAICWHALRHGCDAFSILDELVKDPRRYACSAPKSIEEITREANDLP